MIARAIGQPDHPGRAGELAAAVIPRLALLLLGGLLVACDTGDEVPPPVIVDARPVRVATVEAGAPEETLRLAGVTRAVARARPAFLQSGYLTARPVVRGEAVTAGQRLALLENPVLGPTVQAASARVAELETRLAQHERELERIERLQARELASDEELDRARSQRDASRQALAAARANLDESHGQLARAELVAPFAGRIVTVHAEPGDFVAAGETILELAGSDDALEVELTLPDHAVPALVIGLPVTVLRGAGGGPLEGRLREIGVGVPGRPARAIVELDAADQVRSGEAVHAYLSWTASEALQVPLAAVTSPSGRDAHLFVLRDGAVTRVAVTLGRLYRDRVTVRPVDGGLAAGDRVVISGLDTLIDGDAVRVIR